MFKLVEPNEEVYALWVNKEQFSVFDSLYTNAGYKIIDGEPIRNFASHYGYFIIHKEDKTIGFMETIVFSIYQDKEYYLSDLVKMVDETNDNTSISEQVNRLREIANDWNPDDPVNPVSIVLKRAADTIEDFSTKLQAANMERSTSCYNDGWIPCDERNPEENEEVMLTFENSAGLHVGEAEYMKNMFFYVAETDSGYYEEIYKNPVAWMPKPKPYNPRKDEK